MRRKGFTLLEVLLALVLLVLVVGVLHACLAAILSSTEHGRAIGRSAVEGRNLLELMESDLRGAVMPPGGLSTEAEKAGDKETSDADKYAFVAHTDNTGSEMTDTIRFLTSAPLRGQPAEAPRILHLIEYSLVPCGRGSFSLTRCSTPLDGGDEEAAWQLTDRVKSFQAQFLDGEKWVDEWDSQTSGYLPLAVGLDVALWLDSKPDRRALRMSSAVAIPLAVGGAADHEAEKGGGKR